ncbi:MAG: RNA polymerase sigma factor [bacterium]
MENEEKLMGSSSHPPSCGSESELIEMIRSGAEGAFEELERRYRPRILQQLQQLCRDEEDVKDILQDVLMVLFLKSKSFEGRSSLSTWIYRVTFNAFLMHKRRQKKDRLFLLDEPVQDALLEASHRRTGAHAAQGPCAARLELRLRLRQAFSALPSSYRRVFLAVKVDELPLREVSRRMGISIPAVKSRQHRACRFLRSQLS